MIREDALVAEDTGNSSGEDVERSPESVFLLPSTSKATSAFMNSEASTVREDVKYPNLMTTGTDVPVFTAPAPNYIDPRSSRHRWLGVSIIALLNFMSAWSIIMYAPISDITRQHFMLSTLTPINWLYICATFVYFVVSPISYLVTRRSTKAALILGASSLVLGSWLRYLGTRLSSYPCLLIGTLFCGASQPFALNIPSHYSDLWFEPQSRVTPTALMSLANPLGQAIGTLVVPFLATDSESVTSMTLIVAIIFTATVWTAAIAPGRPPMSGQDQSALQGPSVEQSLRLLVQRKEFLCLFIPFIVYVAAFNAFASLTQQFIQPYGFTDVQAGIIGAVTIVVGLLAGGISAPYLDKTGAYQWPIRVCVLLSATCYFMLVFVIRDYTTGVFIGILVLAGCIGAASLILLPVVLELASDVTAPISPELASSTLWAGGQGLGGIVILIMDQLRESDLRYTHSLIFLIVLTIVPLPFALVLSTSAEVQRCRAQKRNATITCA